MEILLIEDEEYFYTLIKKIITDQIENTTIQICTTIQEANLNMHDYDLAIVDINLPDGDGLEFTRKNAEKFGSILYVTSMENRVYDAFGKNVIGFISKDSILDKLPIKLHEFIQNNKNDHLLLNTQNGLIHVQLKDILYIQTELRKINIFMNNKENILLKRQSIKEFSKQLDPRFVWINQSTIINLDYVYSWKKDEITLTDNVKLYASRKYTKEALSSFMEWNHL